MSCNVLQCVAVCCSVLQSVLAFDISSQIMGSLFEMRYSVLRRAVVRCSVLQCVLTFDVLSCACAHARVCLSYVACVCAFVMLPRHVHSVLPYVRVNICACVCMCVCVCLHVYVCVCMCASSRAETIFYHAESILYAMFVRVCVRVFVYVR